MDTDRYDIAVIGGGIHGAAIAWDATLRGFSTVLLEKGDIGSGASAGNYRIIHGGLRYLQHFDFLRLFESAEEQQIFRRIAPDALDPLPFLIPCYGFGMRGREVLRAGLAFYDLLTCWRNRHVEERLALPWHRSLNASEVLKLAPYLERQKLRGGVLYYDVQMRDPDRLTLSFVQSASERGCKVKNYTEVVGAELSSKSREISSLRCRDVLSGAENEISARLVINAAGAWRERVASILLGGTQASPTLFSKGLQLTLPLLTDVGVALESKFRDKEAFVSKGNRSYFLQPWRGYTIAGTADIIHTEHPDRYRLTDEEIELFLSELRSIYPDSRISRENVLTAFGGLRPVTSQARERYQRGELSDYGSIEVAHRDVVLDHRQQPGDLKAGNLISVEGIKYTTTRRLAERVLNLAETCLEKRSDCLTRVMPLHYKGVTGKIDSQEIRRIVREEFVRIPADLIERRLGYGALPPLLQEERNLIERVFIEVTR